MFLSCLQNSPWLISNATVPQSKSNSLLSARSCSSATTTDPCSAVCMMPGQEQGNITWNAKQHDFSHSKPCKKLASYSSMFCFCTAKNTRRTVTQVWQAVPDLWHCKGQTHKERTLRNALHLRTFLTGDDSKVSRMKNVESTSLSLHCTRPSSWSTWPKLLLLSACLLSFDDSSERFPVCTHICHSQVPPLQGACYQVLKDMAHRRKSIYLFRLFDLFDLFAWCAKRRSEPIDNLWSRSTWDTLPKRAPSARWATHARKDASRPGSYIQLAWIACMYQQFTSSWGLPALHTSRLLTKQGLLGTSRRISFQVQRSQLPSTSICTGNTESCLNSPFFRFFVLPHRRDGNPGYVDSWMHRKTSQNPRPEPLLLLGWLFHILMQVQESSLNGNSSTWYSLQSLVNLNAPTKWQSSWNKRKTKKGLSKKDLKGTVCLSGCRSASLTVPHCLAWLSARHVPSHSHS